MHSKKAYYCYCTDEELEAHREQCLASSKPPHYSGRCRDLSDTERKAFEAEGRPAAIRFKAKQEDITVKDLVRGTVTFPKGMIGDFIILRSQGYPIYNFCVTIDDALMEITHVIRGEEHLSNTLRQIMLYEALKFPLPIFAHLSLILGKDRSKLSKRHGHSSVDQYKKLGYLPKALVNYLALLGWSPTTLSEDVEEMLDVEEIIKQFSLERVSKSPGIFDLDKLNFLNGHYIRKLPEDKLLELTKPYLEKAGLVENRDDEWLTKMLMELRGHLNCLSEITEHTNVFYNNQPTPASNTEREIIKTQTAIKSLTSLKNKFSENPNITPEVFKTIIKEVGKENGIKGKDLYMPPRIALTGQQHGPDLGNFVSLVGSSSCIQRIDYTLSNWSQDNSKKNDFKKDSIDLT